MYVQIDRRLQQCIRIDVNPIRYFIVHKRKRTKIHQEVYVVDYRFDVFVP